MLNKLYYGDNLENLRKYVNDETVDLCYIDPPFNSKRNYNQIYNNIGKEDLAQSQAFIDTWKWDDLANIGLAEIKENYHGKFTHQSIALICGLEQVLGKGSLFAYVVNMTLRIAEIHRVLKPTGSFYLHCDPSASHYLKLVLDAIFCSQGGYFRNELIWHYTGNSIPKNCYPRKHDIIFWYSKSKNIQFYPNRILQPYSELTEKRYNHIDKEGKRYKISALRNGKQEIIYRKEGKYCDDVFEIPVLRGKERLGYPTQKPEALLERIIKASSNEGDVILDAFCGCGTTIAVAQRLNRQWIGMDITYQSIGLILKRLTDSFGEGILDTIKLEGIPKDVESAQKLALKKDDRTRKEFEKWAVLTYTNNRAIISDTPLNLPLSRGNKRGFDGIAYFTGDGGKQEKIILQVKSGKVKSADIRDLLGTMAINEASLGVFITLSEPTKEMIKTAKSIGHYQNNYSNPIDKISIVTVKEIIEQQKRLNLKLMIDVLKSAEKQKETKNNQNTLNI